MFPRSPTNTKRRAVFLDRDGTLIRAYDKRPANTVDEIELLSGVPEGLKALKDAGYALIVVTNQGGIALGFISLTTLHQQHERLNDLLIVAKSYPLDAFYWCPHDTSGSCICRKPKPGMLQRAAEELNVNLSQSFMIGDDVRDMQAGKAAGLKKNIMVMSDRFAENDVADHIFATFDLAAKAVLTTEATCGS
jgi:histidinol-phosphate phosphatase family protein